MTETEERVVALLSGHGRLPDSNGGTNMQHTNLNFPLRDDPLRLVAGIIGHLQEHPGAEVCGYDIDLRGGVIVDLRFRVGRHVRTDSR